MKKLLLLFVLISAVAMNGFAQETETLESLKAMKAEKEAVKAGIDAEIAALEKRILEYPGWTTGVGVLFGLDFGGLNNWYALSDPNQRSQAFGIGLTAFANLNQAKYYWRNGLAVNWSRSVLEINGASSNPVQLGTWDLVSSAGYFIWQDKLAVSARAKWSTILFELSPGSVTASAGLSYIPIPNAEIWVHPLGYQYNYPGEDFTSATGASFGASYSGTIWRNIKWNTVLEGFYSYGGDEENGLEARDLHNITWTNGFIIDNLWNGIGVGFNIALRQNRQLARAFGIENSDDWSDLQSLYNLGFSYSIAR